MGRRIIKVSPSLLQQMFTTGAVTLAAEVTDGLPLDARFLRAWYDGSAPGDGVIVLLFEHESWPANAEGELYPVVDVQLRQVQP